LKDYLEVEYNPNSKAFTNYPEKFAKYLFDLSGMKSGQTLLEIGAGRCEMAKAFQRLGVDVHVVDNSHQFMEYAKLSGLKHRQIEWRPGADFRPFGEKTFDFVYSKSLIEHVSEPLELISSFKKLLNTDGKLLTLTPDFEANWWNFYDDVTHIKPFTLRTLEAVYETCELHSFKVFKIRQLPSTWQSRFMRSLSILTAFITPTKLRTKNKWLRWSRELMIVGIAEN